jgi:hypothetical protein
VLTRGILGTGGVIDQVHERDYGEAILSGRVTRGILHTGGVLDHGVHERDYGEAILSGRGIRSRWCKEIE